MLITVQQISAGTAKPEDNPAFNQGLADAYSQYSGIKSSDFNGLSRAEQGRLAAQSLGAAGIKNVGGGFNQGDPTPGFFGGIKDAFGHFKVDARNTLEEAPILGAVPFVGPSSKIWCRRCSREINL